MDGWMQSTGHCHNVLGPGFTAARRRHLRRSPRRCPALDRDLDPELRPAARHVAPRARHGAPRGLPLLDARRARRHDRAPTGRASRRRPRRTTAAGPPAQTPAPAPLPADAAAAGLALTASSARGRRLRCPASWSAPRGVDGPRDASAWRGRRIDRGRVARRRSLPPAAAAPAHGPPRRPRAGGRRCAPRAAPPDSLGSAARPDWPVSQRLDEEDAVDLNDTPEQAEYRDACARPGWRSTRQRRRSCAARARSRTRTRSSPPAASGSASSPRPAWPASPGPRSSAARAWARSSRSSSTRRSPRPACPGILDVIGVGMLGPTIIAHGTDEQKAPLPRPDAPRRRGVVPAVLRARRGLGPRRRADARQAGRGRLAGSLNGQKVWTTNAQFAAYGLLLARTDPEQHKHKGLTHVHRPDGRRGRDDPRPAPDLRRGRVQRGLLRRRRRRPTTRWSGRSTAAGAPR